MDPADDFDLPAYLARIGYDGPLEASLPVLAALHAAHPAAIAFENLTPLSGGRVPLDIGAVQAKLVGSRRGGYCYEHNALFARALKALGFSASGLAARVRWMAPEGLVRPRSHMALLVQTPQGPHLCDVGFGGLTLSAPLALTPDVVQPTPHEPCRLVGIDGTFEVQARTDRGWLPLYRFDLTPHLPPDYEILNWYASTHPASPFVTGLMAARAAPDGVRYALSDARFTARGPDGVVQRALTDVSDLARVLREAFLVEAPDGLDAVAAKIGLPA